MRKTIRVNNITCTNCARSIEMHFNKTEISAKVNVTAGSVIFNFDEDKYTLDYIKDELVSIGYHPIAEDEKANKAKLIDKIDLIIALVFSLPLLYTMFAHLGLSFMPMPHFLMNGWFQFAIATPVLFISGRRFFIASYHSIRAKNLGMDILVVIGTTSAYLYSLVETIVYKGNPGMDKLFFETTAVIIFMVLLGNYFENRIKEKTNETLTSLLSLGAKTATKVVGEDLVEVEVSDLKVGDIVFVKGYDKIPIDGVLIDGETYVDESMLTGESMPVAKRVGDLVIGSSMNLVESIKLEVTKTGSDTVLAKIIETVEETALIKPKTQRVADKISGLFVPIVVVISIIVFITWFIITKDITGAFKPAVAVLVVSCPCALGLATPTSISVSSGMAFKEGVLYKGGEFFETANKITAIAFDKTGTLTEGMPTVTNYIGDEKYLKYTASLEAHSNHPIANAINDYYDGEHFKVTNYETLIGYGIKGNIGKSLVYVVSITYLLENNINNPYSDYENYLEEGKTIFFTVIDNEVVNMLAISDELKESSYKLISALNKRGIKPYMITGDQEKTANFIASKLGIKHVYAKVLPHEKANIIKEIRDSGEFVAFVGDGINDAPALKMADVSFAVGSGSDIALDSSDVNLMKNDLISVLYAIDLSKATLHNIYLNFFWAFIYNIVMIPLAAFKIFNPMIAGIGMAFSSLMVVLNALRLKRFKFKEGE